MGTRSLTVVIYRETVKIAQYGQWDGYPGISGCTLLNFLKSKLSVERLEKILPKTRFQNEIKTKQRNRLFKASDNKPVSTLKDVTRNISLHDYAIGVNILNELLRHEEFREIVLFNSYKFASDSFWCEWAYVIDFDNNVFEVYKGDNHSPLSNSERFFSLQNTASDCYPVKLVLSYNLSELPSDEEFLSHFL